MIQWSRLSAPQVLRGQCGTRNWTKVSVKHSTQSSSWCHFLNPCPVFLFLNFKYSFCSLYTSALSDACALSYFIIDWLGFSLTQWELSKGRIYNLSRYFFWLGIFFLVYCLFCFCFVICDLGILEKNKKSKRTVYSNIIKIFSFILLEFFRI